MTIQIVYTGGTLGSVGEPLAPLQGAEFERRLRELLERVHPSPDDLKLSHTEKALDSTNLTPGDWLDLASLVAQPDSSERLLLLHGTDTMAWTASALGFLLQTYDRSGRPTGRLGKRLVITGSQQPLFEGTGLKTGSDALANLRGGLEVASRPGSGVLLHFGGLTMPGGRVLKRSTSDFEGFACPNGEGAAVPLDAVSPEEVGQSIASLSRHFGTKQILVLTASPGSDIALQAKAMIDNLGDRVGALHLLGFGAGNLPEEAALRHVLAEASARSIPVVVSSQCQHGAVTSAYAVGSWLLDCNVIPNGDMTVPAVQTKLHLALALGAQFGWELDQIAAFMQTNIAGELSS